MLCKNAGKILTRSFVYRAKEDNGCDVNEAGNERFKS